MLASDRGRSLPKSGGHLSGLPAKQTLPVSDSHPNRWGIDGSALKGPRLVHSSGWPCRRPECEGIGAHGYRLLDCPTTARMRSAFWARMASSISRLSYTCRACVRDCARASPARGPRKRHNIFVTLNGRVARFEHAALPGKKLARGKASAACHGGTAHAPLASCTSGAFSATDQRRRRCTEHAYALCAMPQWGALQPPERRQAFADPRPREPASRPRGCRRS